jgi:outer membrane protein OmpA-like peptidoglycan-associated protein/tetratricopeptide (TPR) repeat protein
MVWRLLFLLLIVSSLARAGSAASDTGKVLRQAKIQEWLLEARTLAEEERYESAVRAYKKVLQFDSTRYIYNFELGMVLFYYQENKKAALKYLERAFAVSPRDTSYDLIKCLGQSYQFVSNYPEAMRYYNLYGKKEARNRKYEAWNKEVEQGISVCKYAMSHNVLADSVKVENLGRGINSMYPEYAPVADSKDSFLLYCSRRPDNNSGRKDPGDNKFYEDIFISYRKNSTWSRPVTFDAFRGIKDEAEEDVHKSVVGMSYDENNLFLYRKNKLWISTRKGNQWLTPVMADNNINLSQYQTHNSLSADGNTMFVAAETRDGKGGRDIFMLRKKADGSWDTPISIGDLINTDDDENSPLISSDGKTLYFSSKGLPGYGGYDIFKTSFVDGSWTVPVNMGLPINSPGDDLHFQYIDVTGRAYFASNRQGGYGDMDLYTVSPQTEKLIEYIPINFSKQFHVGDYTNEKTVNAVYHWNFGDGKTAEGKHVMHTYTHPGPFEGMLSIKDSTRKVELYSYPVHVAFQIPAHLEIDAIDTIAEGQILQFSAGNSFIENMRIRNYQWSFGDGSVADDSSKIQHLYTTRGMYNVKLICRGLNEKSRSKVSYYVNKNIVVLPPEEYLSWERKKNIQTVTKSNENSGKKNNRSILKRRKIFLEGGFDELGITADTLKLPAINLESVYFDLDKHNLRTDAMQTLDKNAEILLRYPDLVIQVTGMADIRGSEDYNILLSSRRAVNAVRYLNEKGVAISRFSAVVSSGESYSSAAATGEDAFRKDRRVEFRILGKANPEIFK